ncbi:MAG: family 43 glycosylhydrolase, partial [Muribaculaceae bacterium]|nr:family 43 glycosylhydrolase [Muribaculaceae bacterium]
MKFYLSALMAFFALACATAANPVYTNPIIDEDYSDPDAIRVGDDYYLTASSFANAPGMPILHSKDLVNWEIVNRAVKKVPPYDYYDAAPRHGKGIWAPSIREHEGLYY